MPIARIPHVAVWIETSRGYGRGLLRGVAEYVRERGPWSIYFTPHGLREPYATPLRDWSGDGILARIDDRKMAKLLLAKKLPLIDLRGRLPDLGISTVGLDNRPVARMAFEHLHERGLRHFAFYGLRPGAHVHLDQRRTFFCDLVKNAGLKCHVFVHGRQSTAKATRDRLEAWLGQLPKPIGIMSCNDDNGQQLLDGCRRAGVVVPDQVAVVGVDNDEELCNLSTPALSSVDVNARRIGYAAAALLDKMIASKNRLPRQDVVFPPSHVITRLSTDTVAVEDPIVARALRFIRGHAWQPISVGDVVEASQASRRLLERQMRAILGTSPNDEILRVRIGRARELLLESDLPLRSIAIKCGFRGAKYFGDAFLRQVGLSPGAFRRRERRYDVAS